MVRPPSPPAARRSPLLASAGALALGLALACGGGPESTEPAPEEGAPSEEGAALERIRKHGALTVGMDMGEDGKGTPPMVFLDAAGKPDGFDHTVARWVATAVGVPEVRIVHGKYSELPEMLRASKEIDVLISGFPPSAEPGIQWSDSYLDYGLCLVVRSDSRIKTVADLAGESVGLFADEAARVEVERLVKGHGGLVQMEDGYWDALADGKIAGFLYDYPYAVAEIEAWYQAHPDRRGAFRFAQYNLNDMHYAIGVRDGEPELLQAVNEAILRFWQSDEYGAAVRRYLSGGATVQAAAPAAEAGGAEAAAAQPSYVVKAGDSLGSIARDQLGDGDRWKEIWALNRGRIPNPHLIEVGDRLLMPG